MRNSTIQIRLRQLCSKTWFHFFALSILVFLLPSILGHPFISGDNLIQFNPLRMLAGKIEAQGHLPLWNQFNWSGTPLLAGFNAGVYFPTSWLYIFLPTSIAWGISQALPYFLASFGFYKLTREFNISQFSSKITGLAYAFTGVMITQGVHLDMIIGISLAPWMIMLVRRILIGDSSSRLRNVALLAFCYALVVLAGAPEAMLDELIMLVVYALVRLRPFNKVALRKYGWLALAGILALALSGAQWIPGLEYQKISQRAHPSLAFVSFGAFAPQDFFSMFTPYLFGGPGIANASRYFGPFNWEEIVIYPGVGPTIALFATILRTVRKKFESELTPFLIVGAVGIVLAFGSYTPVESWLHGIPLYGQQRLSGRNMLQFDVAIFAIFAFWLDRLLRGLGTKRLASLVAFVPAVASGALFLGFLYYQKLLSNILHAGKLPPNTPKTGELAVFATQFAVALICGFVYLRAPSFNIRIGKRLITLILLLDIITFNIFGSLGTISYSSQMTSSTPQMSLLHSIIGNNERFAIYDPHLYSYYDLNKFGEPDLNIAAGNHSIQGYSSLSLENYEEATGSHAQATLNASLINSNLINTLGTKAILTNWRYFISPYGSPTLVPIPKLPKSDQTSTNTTGSSTSSSGTTTTGFFGKALSVKSIDINYGTKFSATSILKVGLMEPSGSTKWLFRTSSLTAPKKALHYSVSAAGVSQINAIGVTLVQRLPQQLNDPQQALTVGVGVQSSAGYYALTGALEEYLTYPHYHFASNYGTVSLFENNDAKPIIQTSSPDVHITSASTQLDGTLDLKVSATVNSYVYWAEAYAPGWYATLTSEKSDQVIATPVEKNGILQKIPVPPGRWILDVAYHGKGIIIGIILSLAAVVVELILLISRSTITRRNDGKPADYEITKSKQT